MQNTEAVEYVKQAFELKSQKSYKQAIEMLYKALELESDNVEIIFQLGELYYLLHNYERAEQYLLRNPAHKESLRLLRDIYFERKDFEKALEKAEKVPQDVDRLIQILSKLGKIDRIKELEKSAKDILIYPQALYDNNEPAQAKKILEKQEPSVLLGKIYFDEGNLEKSKEIFGQLSTDNAEVLNYLGLFALEEINFIDAIKSFSKAVNLDKQNAVYYYNLANAYFYNGWVDEAIKAYLNASCYAPDNMDYRSSLAYLYYENKMFDKARNEVDFIFSNVPNHHQTVILNALLKLEQKDFLGAKADLEKMEPDDFALISLAKVYCSLGLLDKARGAVEKVIARNPENLSYQCDMAEIYISEKQYEQALEIVEKTIKKNENFILAYVLGAKAAYEMKDFKKAKSYAQNAISLDINYAPGYYYLALVWFEEGDIEEAIECMRRAILADVGNAEYYAKMSEFYRAAEDIKTSLDYIKEAVSISETAEYKAIYSELASLNRKGNLSKK